MTRKLSRGYTLIELIVVVAIVAILAAVGLPQYTRSVETTRAIDGMNTARMIGNAAKSYFMDRGVYANGRLTNACNTACCAGTAGCAAAADSPCNLVACGYMPKREFIDSPYTYVAAAPGGACAGSGPTAIACVMRKQCPDFAEPGCIDIAAWPYRCWGYAYDVNNIVTPHPNPKSPAPFPD